MKSENGRIKAVIFDLGNVLVDFDHLRAASRIARFCAKSPEEIYGLFFESALTALFEQGKISPLDFYQGVKKMLGMDLSFESFVPIWNEIFFVSEKNRGVYSLIHRLNKRYKVALLSNVNVLHFEYLKNNFPVFDGFHHLFASCHLGAMKPDARVYQKVLDAMKVSAGEAFYTDDRLDLIESAKALGITAYVFQGVAKLKTDLQNAGLEIN